MVLLLRDILDAPQATVEEERGGYYQVIDDLYDKTKVKKSGKALKMKAPAFRLVVACRDAAGNIATAAAAPPFARH